MRVTESFLHRRRRHCEERRSYLTELDLLAERLRAAAGQLQTEIERAGDPALAQPLIERLGKLERSLATVKSQITAANDALAAAELELQRSELVSARRTGNAGATDRRPAPRTRPEPPPIAGSDRGS